MEVQVSDANWFPEQKNTNYLGNVTHPGVTSFYLHWNVTWTVSQACKTGILWNKVFICDTSIKYASWEKCQ
jgi:hypothetical protein